MMRISAPSAGAEGSVTVKAVLVSAWYSVVAARVELLDEVRVDVENPPG